MLSMRFLVLLFVVALFVSATADAAKHNKAKHFARNRHHVLAKQGVNAADKVNVLAEHKAAGVANAKNMARKHKANKVVVRGADDQGQNQVLAGKQMKVPAAGMMLNKHKFAVKNHHANKKAHHGGVLAKNQVKVNAAGL